MKKSSIILIGVVYVALIVFISVFGLKAVIYNPIYPVESVECINQSTDKITVGQNSAGIKTIKAIFNNASEAIITLEWRVLPDNATNKNVCFKYQPASTFTFLKDETGREIGQIKFYSTTPVLDVEIESEDSSRKSVKIKIQVKVN